MIYTDRDIRDLYARRWQEFGRECGTRAIVVLVAGELQVSRDRVWRALAPVSVRMSS